MPNVCLEDILGLVHTERPCSEVFRQADPGPGLPGFESQIHYSMAHGRMTLDKFGYLTGSQCSPL